MSKEADRELPGSVTRRGWLRCVWHGLKVAINYLCQWSLIRSRRAFIVPVGLLVLALLLYGSKTSYEWHEVFLVVFRDGLPLIFLAIGAGLVLAAGYVDLSIAGNATASAFLFIVISFNVVGASPHDFSYLELLTLGLLTIALSAGLGALMAAGIVYGNAPPLLLTWAVGAILLISPLLFITSLPKEMGASAGDVPASFLSSIGMNVQTLWYSSSGWLDLWFLHGFGPLALLALSVIFVLVTVLKFTNTDRRACAIGANDLSAYYAGVNKRATVIRVYAIAGGLAGLAGISKVVLNQSLAIESMRGWELFAIAIAVLAGTSMSGGFIYLGPIVISALSFSAIQFYTSIIMGLSVDAAGRCGEASGSGSFACAMEPHIDLITYTLFYIIFILVVLFLGRFLNPNIGVVLKNWEQDMPK